MARDDVCKVFNMMCQGFGCDEGKGLGMMRDSDVSGVWTGCGCCRGLHRMRMIMMKAGDVSGVWT